MVTKGKHIAEHAGRLVYDVLYMQGGARNVIPLIVHVTHFYYYKNIWLLVQN